MSTAKVNIQQDKDPPDVEWEDVEDFLATDDLFVEYFNVFLGLPTFPVPLCFNKDTGGFEVVSDAKKDLAKQIKTAMRSQKRTPRMYKVAKKHSFIDIPLIPIDNVVQNENVEINTSFSVTTLNKEQGIHWIKAERLPAFLESDLYLEYRLSKLLSQARITGEQGEYILMKIEFKPKVKKVKKKEVEEEVKTDPKEALMKNLYVCMGNAGTTDTDAWYSTAKIAQETESTYSALSRPQSETVTSKSGGRPVSARPASAYTDHYQRSDSGMGSSLKSSARVSSYGNMSQTKYSTVESEDDILVSKLFSADGRPHSHKITESLCMVNKEHSSRTRPFSATVYSTPKVVNTSADPDASIIEDDIEKDDEKDSGKGDDENDGKSGLNDSLNSDSDEGRAFTFKNIDDIGAVIVGVVLKTALSKLVGKTDLEIDDVPELQKLFPDKSFANLTVDSLEKICLLEESEKLENKVEEKTEMVNERMKKVLDEESDVDSLLDSEEDYEEQDTFFRKHKFKVFSLTNRKGIEQFKRFLKGSQGEKNWNLWVDIDRMKLMTNEEEIQLYLNGLREKYHLPGAEFELTVEQKTQLELVEPSSWTLDKMFDIQNDIAEPLVLYWAPRFLLKQLMRTEPNKNQLYQHQKLLDSLTGIDPHPHTVNLLPLRPKSCHPRLRNGAIEPERTGPEIQPSPFHLYPEQRTQQPETSPPVGMHRSYTQPTLEFIAQWQKNSEEMQSHERQSPRSPRSPGIPLGRTSTPRIKSAPPTKSSVLARPKSGRSLRPSSARSTSSRLSIESATGRYRIKSALERPKSSQISLKLPSETGIASPRHNGERLSRPGSAASSITSVSSLRSEAEESETSEFLGGRRMETLLQALHYEPDSGGFFRHYVERSGNKRWLNNLNFWRDVQAYHLLFYSKTLDAYTVNKKAKAIHSQYIVVGAFHPICCSLDIARDIYSHIDPPFEELFDEVEEHSITVLYEAWQLMLDTDEKTYNKVELIEVKRHLETKSKYVVHLQKRGLIKQRASTPDMMEGYQDPVYDEALLQNIPEQFKDYTLEKLVHNRIELEHFRIFLADNYASMDIMCWMDIEAFRRITHTDDRKRDQKAKEIKTKYLNKKYFFGPNSPAGKEGQEKVVEAGGGWGKLLEDRPPNPMILEAQKYVQERLEKKWLPLFLVTPEFEIRQKPRTSMDEVVDDVLVQKKKKSQAVWKLLESKWVSSSKEIITFRKALLNPVTSLQFRRYVSIKGDTLENNVLFWLEVQKFKNMYHAHNDDSLINLKINTIINCFIESQIPPTLQIDIPQEMADKILDHKYERSPYLFREAQLIVFRVLFGLWNEFCEFRSNLADEKIMPMIERRRKHAKIKERQRQQELEEKQAREAERRAALGLPPLGEDEDVFHDPFKSHGAESVEGEQEVDEKDKISWSYSNYMAALETEELLNNTDETSFSSLLTPNTASEKEVVSDKDSVGSRHSELGEKKTGKIDIESQTTERRKSVKASNGKKLEDADVPKKVKDTGSRKSSVDVLERRASQTKSSVEALERRASQTKLSGGILQKTPSPDTTVSSKKTLPKDSKTKTNGALKT